MHGWMKLKLAMKKLTRSEERRREKTWGGAYDFFTSFYDDVNSFRVFRGKFMWKLIIFLYVADNFCFFLGGRNVLLSCYDICR